MLTFVHVAPQRRGPGRRLRFEPPPRALTDELRQLLSVVLAVASHALSSESAVDPQPTAGTVARPSASRSSVTSSSTIRPLQVVVVGRQVEVAVAAQRR